MNTQTITSPLFIDMLFFVPACPPTLVPACSQSGRFDRLKELAVEHAFLLKVQGMKDTLLQPSGPADEPTAAVAASGTAGQ